MGAGWLYYHKYPPKRKCPNCGKRHYARRIGTFSNGEDVWQVFCTQPQKTEPKATDAVVKGRRVPASAVGPVLGEYSR